MRQNIAEYLKLISALGIKSGLRIGLKKSSASKTFPVQLPGIIQKTWIRKGTSDWTAFKQVFVWKEYDYPIAFVPNTILDAGSNVGYAALWFTRKFPQAKIVSLEPETTNFQMLEKNTANYANIKPVQAGLWDRGCYLKITHADWGNWGFRTEEIESPTEDAIRAVSILDIMEQQQWKSIDLLKMDIEGAERKVFAADTDHWLPKTKMIFLELHDNVYPDCSKKVFSELLKYDFRVDVSGENLIFINNSLSKK